jgi:hypothetical protein
LICDLKFERFSIRKRVFEVIDSTTWLIVAFEIGELRTVLIRTGERQEYRSNLKQLVCRWCQSEEKTLIEAIRDVIGATSSVEAVFPLSSLWTPSAKQTFGIVGRTWIAFSFSLIHRDGQTVLFTFSSLLV